MAETGNQVYGARSGSIGQDLGGSYLEEWEKVREFHQALQHLPDTYARDVNGYSYHPKTAL